MNAFRYELGTFERQIAKDYVMVQGIKSVALPLSAGLLGLGLATAGFLAFNKVDDLTEWLGDQWEDGFGLVNDPTQTQEQVSTSVSPHRNPVGMEGMSASSIYHLFYDMRDDLRIHFARMWCLSEGREFTGPNVAHFDQYYWSTSFLGTSNPNMPTYRNERSEVVHVIGSAEEENKISEYVYQMIIRETDSRNTSARLASGLFGAASTGIGAAFSEATHWALRSSGFMRGSDGWNGQNWEEANGANRDPLLMFAWARTDFQTGKWWSTVDSQGDIGFWLDVATGNQHGARFNGMMENPESYSSDVWSYEQIIRFAHDEMANDQIGPFLRFLSGNGALPIIMIDTDPSPAIPTGDQDPDYQEPDDWMVGEEPPQDDPEDSYGPPR